MAKKNDKKKKKIDVATPKAAAVVYEKIDRSLVKETLLFDLDETIRWSCKQYFRRWVSDGVEPDAAEIGAAVAQSLGMSVSDYRTRIEAFLKLL